MHAPNLFISYSLQYTLYPTFFSFYTYVFIILCLDLSSSYPFVCLSICYSIVCPYTILLCAYAFYLYPSLSLSYYHPVSLILSYCSSLYLLNVSDVFPYYILLYVIYYILWLDYIIIAYAIDGIPALCFPIFSHSFPYCFP